MVQQWSVVVMHAGRRGRICSSGVWVPSNPFTRREKWFVQQGIRQLHLSDDMTFSFIPSLKKKKKSYIKKLKSPLFLPLEPS